MFGGFLHQFAIAVDGTTELVGGHGIVTGKSLFDDLPDRFTRGELYVKATQCGLTTPVRNILYQWKQAGLITKRNAQEYQKAKKGK